MVSSLSYAVPDSRLQPDSAYAQRPAAAMQADTGKARLLSVSIREAIRRTKKGQLANQLPRHCRTSVYSLSNIEIDPTPPSMMSVTAFSAVEKPEVS